MALQLVIVEGPDAGRSFDLAGDVVVGRDPTAAVQLADEAVSRRHAIVTAGDGDGDAVVEDLGSSNGTWVDEQQVNGSAALALGGRLRIGSTVLELREGEGDGQRAVASSATADPPATKVPLPDWREGRPD